MSDHHHQPQGQQQESENGTPWNAEEGESIVGNSSNICLRGTRARNDNDDDNDNDAILPRCSSRIPSPFRLGLRFGSVRFGYPAQFRALFSAKRPVVLCHPDRGATTTSTTPGAAAVAIEAEATTATATATEAVATPVMTAVPTAFVAPVTLSFISSMPIVLFPLLLHESFLLWDYTRPCHTDTIALLMCSTYPNPATLQFLVGTIAASTIELSSMTPILFTPSLVQYRPHAVLLSLWCWQ